MSIKAALATGVAAAAVAAAGYFGHQRWSAAPAAAAPPPVRVVEWAEAIATDLRQQRRLPGVLTPIAETELSFEVAGRVDAVAASLGQTVEAGATLAQLDRRDYQLAVKSADAALQQARARLVEADQDYRRRRQLIDRGATSEAELDTAKANRDAARSQVEAARAGLEIAAEDLADTTLKAPWNGVVSARRIEPSQRVSVGETAFALSGDRGLEVALRVPETLIRQLYVGQHVTIRFPAVSGVELTGSVIEIGSRARDGNAFPVNVALARQRDDLRAGMTAEVTLSFSAARAAADSTLVLLPVSALLAGDGQRRVVFVYDEASGTVARREVQPVNIRSNDVIIGAGLEPGERVVSAGGAFLNDGQRVELLDPDTKRF